MGSVVGPVNQTVGSKENAPRRLDTAMHSEEPPQKWLVVMNPQMRSTKGSLNELRIAIFSGWCEGVEALLI